MKYIFASYLIFSFYFTLGQFPSFKIGGLSRSLSNISSLDSQDTINKDINQELNIVFDLALDAKLNEKINFYSELRLGSSLEVFDTSASYINIRRILLFGKISKNIKFEVGDIDVKMTPFTLWNNEEEGVLVENDLFLKYREIQRYENFNIGNNWRRQGAKLNGVNNLFTKDTLKYHFFISREQASNEISTPDRFLYGETLSYKRPKFSLGAQHIDLFTFNKGIFQESNIHNHVFTFNSSYKDRNISANLELGQSSRTLLNSLDNSSWLNGQFLNLNLNYRYAKNSYLEVNYRRVTDDFSSPGAQTKRIDFSSSTHLFPSVNNTLSSRDILVSDIINDITFFRQNSIYNRTIDYDLDKFNPLLGLSQPYGRATPNRQGIDIDFFLKDSLNIFDCFAGSSFLTDLTGEGTNNLRTYFQLRFGAEFALYKLINSKRKINLQFGLKSDNILRTHPNELFVDNVKVNSNLLDAGAEIEILNKLFFLLAYKKLAVDGVDYLGVRDHNFRISSFDLFIVDSDQDILSLGFSYDFNKKTTFLINAQRIRFEDKINLASYSFNQIFALIQLKF